jgi:hypothetical protein
LPEEQRDQIRKQFTPGWGRLTEVDMAGTGYPSAITGVDTAHPVEDVVSRIRKHLGPTVAGTTALDPDPMKSPASAPSTISSRADLEAALFGMTIDRGKMGDDFPDVTWLTVNGGDGEPLEYTLLANRIFKSNSRLVGNFFPGLNRLPEMDSLSVVRGHIGAFPQLFLQMSLSDAADAVKGFRGTHAQHVAVRSKYEVRRNTNAFWTFLDNEHTRQLKNNPLESGIVDTSRYLWPIAIQPDAVGKVE